MRIAALVAALALTSCAAWSTATGAPPDAVAIPATVITPQRYTCPRAPGPLTLDGELDEAAWEAAPWTRDFADIRGGDFPAPWFRTRAKMLWDDEFFYVGAELEEEHVWANLTARDSIIFYDNDFEVFIDPDGDTHEYYEHEMNALGTDWDLFLVKPYRDGGPAVHGWDIAGLVTEAAVHGTINDPSDTDRGWSVEIAIPWAALAEAAHRPSPPAPGDTWRVGFSRVEWRTHVEDGKYVKDTDPATGKNLPEENWVWSPQGIVNMHYPETWGLVQFVERSDAKFVVPDDLEARHRLREIYFELRNAAAVAGTFRGVHVTPRPDLPGWGPPVVEAAERMFEASMRHADGRRLTIREDGRIRMLYPTGGK